MPMAVKTAMSLGSATPVSMKFGTKEIAAPTAPKAVMGKAMASGYWNPKIGSKRN